MSDPSNAPPDVDPLLEQLAEHAREDRRGEDPRLADLARGQLPAPDEAALIADADRDPDLADQVRAFTPLSTDFVARLAEQAAASAAKEPELEIPPPAKIIPIRRFVAPLMAVAAAAVLVFALTSRGPAALPAFTGSVQAGDAILRSEGASPAGPTTLRSDSLVTIQLSPTTALDGPLEAALFVVTSEGIRRAPGIPEVASSGSVRVRGSAAELLGAARGPVEAILVVARPGKLPAPADVRGSGPWRTKSVRLVLTSE